jgi:glycine hydroxymethyltransferase
MMKSLSNFDQGLANLLEMQDQQLAKTLNLIASENVSSLAVRQACASSLTDKYAEGYPGKRYYAGCEYADQIELLAIDRAKKLFGAAYANVQPHCGSSANMGVYAALLEPGDVILSMNLAAGGHLTHGHPLNFSGKLYQFVWYGVHHETEYIDMDEVRSLALKHKPRMIIAGASAYSRIIDFAAFAAIAHEVGAYFMVDMAHIAGLVAAGAHPSPVPYADVVTSTTHKTLRGPRGGLILAKPEFGSKIDKAIMPGIQGGPLLNLIASKAVAFHEAMSESFVLYAQQVVQVMRLIALDLNSSGFRCVSGGTDNHLALFDLRSMGMSGKEVESRLSAIGIFVNRNCIPFDPAPPLITSGIRLGSPALVSRGLTAEMVPSLVALIVDGVFKRRSSADLQEAVSKFSEALL